jgi:alanine racemase
VEEGVELRALLPESIIYVLYGVQPGQEEASVQANLIPVLNDTYQIELWQKYAKKLEKKLKAVVHVDTGMCRLGLGVQQFEKSWRNNALFESIEVICVMSHLACSSEPEHYLNARQLHYANQIKEQVGKVPVSLANSCGIFMGEEYHFDIVRPGASLYGVDPLPEGKANPMRRVVTVKTRIIQVRDITKPETVGYGATYEAPAGSRIAVIAMGYADGYIRAQSNKGICYVGGCLVPVVGRVSMDLVMIDVTNVPEHAIYPGAEVEVIGKHVTIHDVAKHGGTIEYEVLTNLGRRYKRIYKGGGK